MLGVGRRQRVFVEQSLMDPFRGFVGRGEPVEFRNQTIKLTKSIT
jgi:hypothetical protein